MPWGAPKCCQHYSFIHLMVLFTCLFVWTWTGWPPQRSGLRVDPRTRRHSSLEEEGKRSLSACLTILLNFYV